MSEEKILRVPFVGKIQNYSYGKAECLLTNPIAVRMSDTLFSTKFKMTSKKASDLGYYVGYFNLYLNSGRRILAPERWSLGLSGFRDFTASAAKFLTENALLMVEINKLAKDYEIKVGAAILDEIERIKTLMELNEISKEISGELAKLVVGIKLGAKIHDVALGRLFQKMVKKSPYSLFDRDAKRAFSKDSCNSVYLANVLKIGHDEIEEASKVADSSPEVEEKATPKSSLPKLPREWSQVGNVYVKREQLKVIDAAVNIPNMNILAVGESGYGKTSLPKAYSELKGMKYVRVNCSAVRDPLEWFIYMGAKNGSTFAEKTELAKALEEGNAIIVLDEFNRVEPWIANPMLQIMDFEGRTNVRGTEVVRGEKVVFFATANIGTKFSGTFAIDSALMNRFAVKVKVNPVPAEVETRVLVEATGIEIEVAERISKFFDRSRTAAAAHNRESVDISTRTSLNVAKLVANGVSFQDAVNFTILTLPSSNSPLRKDLTDISQTA